MTLEISDHHLYCLIRKKWVLATPEEIVRQTMIKKMIGDLGFSYEGFAIEKGLDQMPHLSYGARSLPKRRADIIYFAKDIHPVHTYYPLLLIECKAVPINAKMMRQIIGYNYYVLSFFVALANQDQMCLGWKDPIEKDYAFLDYLPTCQQLQNAWVTNEKSIK